MLDSKSLLYIILGLILLKLLHFLYRVLIYPYLLVLSYRKQKIPMMYYPVLGLAKNLISDVNDKGDFQYLIKQHATMDPKPAIVGSNMAQSSLICVIDPNLIK